MNTTLSLWKKYRSIVPTIGFQIITILLIAIGAGLRLAQYFTNRSLWLDEASLTLNIVNRSFIGLTQPLDYVQAAPILFAWVERLLLKIFGNSELVFRLFPLLCGCLALFLFLWVARRILTLPGVVWALSLFAVNGSLIYYSSEVKQYSSDVFVTLGLLSLFAYFVEKPLSVKNITICSLVGMVSLWLAHPALFVLAAIGSAWFLKLWVKKNFLQMFRLGIVIILWVLSFALLYGLSLRIVRTNEILIQFWQSFFMPSPPWSNLAWFSFIFERLFRNPVGLDTPLWLNGVLFLSGTVYLFRQKWEWAIALLGPLFLTLLASGFHLYPFGDRLVLFCIPLIFLILTSGLVGIVSWVAKMPRLLVFLGWFSAIIVILVMLYSPVTSAWRVLNQPDPREHTRPVIAYVKTHFQPGDQIYVYYGAVPAFNYYANINSLEVTRRVNGAELRSQPEKYWQDISQLFKNGRTWVIFSHIYTGAKGSEKDLILAMFDKAGQRLDEIAAPGAAAYLYDLTP